MRNIPLHEDSKAKLSITIETVVLVELSRKEGAHSMAVRDGTIMIDSTEIQEQQGHEDGTK